MLGLAPIAHATPPAGQGYSLVWSDDFTTDTALDMTHWGYMWTGAYEGATNTSSAVVLANHYLAIKAYTYNGSQYAGIIGTQNKYQPKYGYIEASIRWANTGGTWSALWTFDDTIGASSLPHTDGVEADIAEHRALDGSGANVSDSIDAFLHWDGYVYGIERNQGLYSLGAGLSTGFHIYGMAWTPTSQTFYIDGVSQWTVANDLTDADPAPPLVPVSQISQYLLLSTIVKSGGWAGTMPVGGYGSLATTTTEMDVQYVNVYQIGPPTPLAPVNVTVAPATSGWTIGWNMTDNAPYYHVKRATVSGGPYTTIATTGIAKAGEDYVDTTAVTGTVYYYVVSAVNGTQESPNSLEVRTAATGIPGSARTGVWAAQAILSGKTTLNNMTQTVSITNATNLYSLWARGSGTIGMRIYNMSGVQIAAQSMAVTPAWTYYRFYFSPGTNTQVQARVDDESSTVGAVSIDDLFLGVEGSTNLLTNPGLESGSTGWSTYNAAGTGTTWNAVNCGASSSGNEHAGFQAARAIFTGTPTYNRITQTVNVATNTTYQYGIWAKGGGSTSLRVYSGANGSQISTTLNVNPTSTWTYYSTSFNSGTNTQVTVRMDDQSYSAATMYVDDVFLGISGGTNLLVNPGFERSTVGWDSSSAGTVWTIGQW